MNKTVKTKIFFLCFVAISLFFSCAYANDADFKDFFGNAPYIPDIETFMQIGGVSRASISPDGQTIFLIPNFTSVGQIFRITPEDRYPFQLTFLKEGVNDYTLSPNGKWIVLRSDTGGNENFQLYLVEAKSGKIKPLTKKPEVRYGSVVWSPDSKKIYYSANSLNKRYFNIYVMDLSKGEEKLILDEEGYFGPCALSLDGKLLLYYKYFSNVDSNLYIMNLETGKKKLLTPHKDAYLFQGIAISPDNRKAYIVTNMNEKGSKKLATVDIQTGKIDFIYDFDSLWDVDDISPNQDCTKLALTINENGYGRLRILDLKTLKELPVPSLDGIVDNPIFGGESTVIFSLNTPVSPTEIYLWDWESKKLTKLTNSSFAGIDPELFVAPKLIKYKSFDGLEIPAFLYLPPDWEKNKGNIPFVIHFHGGPESQFRPYFQRHFNYLLLHGFGVLAPNIRGSGGYGKKYQDMDNYKKRMDSVKDGYYAAKYLIEQGYTKQGKIGIKGGSYGGFMVMALLTEYPDMWGAGIESIGIVDFVNFMKNTSSYRQALRESEYGPLSDLEFLKSISPIHKLDRIKVPVMVIHGKNDPRVPVSEAYMIINNLKKRGVEVEALIFEDEGHGVEKKENLLIEHRKMVEFFEKWLKR